jgi:hypothetical protein
VLVAWFLPEEDGNLTGHLDTLSAVGTLAAAALENARDVERLQTENAILLGSGSSGMVRDSPALHKLQQMMARLAPQDTPVLILGESGTGKGLVARGLHAMSARAARPFVAINCAALSEALLESELFGHEKGAFTGAVAQKKGKLEIAQGGTVFLDEMGELPMAIQAKLLRVLQEREFERVGGTQTFKLDIRLVAATNRNLAAEVRRGAFREDLYHRVNVVALHTPPLRDRPGDIPALANHIPGAFGGAVPAARFGHFRGCRALPVELRVAGKCEGVGKRYRTRGGVGAIGADSGGGSAGDRAGVGGLAGDPGSAAVFGHGDEAPGYSGGVAGGRRRPSGSGPAVESPSQFATAIDSYLEAARYAALSEDLIDSQTGAAEG